MSESTHTQTRHVQGVPTSMTAVLANPQHQKPSGVTLTRGSDEERGPSWTGIHVARNLTPPLSATSRALPYSRLSGFGIRRPATNTVAGYTHRQTCTGSVGPDTLMAAASLCQRSCRPCTLDKCVGGSSGGLSEVRVDACGRLCR